MRKLKIFLAYKALDTDNPVQKSQVYKLFVTTSDIKFAGTDANVFVNIVGDQAETG